MKQHRFNLAVWLCWIAQLPTLLRWRWAHRTQVVLLPDDAHPVAKFWAFVRGNGVQSQIATNILRLHDNDHEAALAELIAAKEQTLEPAG